MILKGSYRSTNICQCDDQQHQSLGDDITQVLTEKKQRQFSTIQNCQKVYRKTDNIYSRRCSLVQQNITINYVNCQHIQVCLCR